MHRRKKFLIYPKNYKPGDGFVIRYSKRQAGASFFMLLAKCDIPRIAIENPGSYEAQLLQVLRKQWPINGLYFQHK